MTSAETTAGNACASPAPTPALGRRWHAVALLIGFLAATAAAWTGFHLWVNCVDLLETLPAVIVRYADAPICRLQAFVFLWCLVTTVLEWWEARRAAAAYARSDSPRLNQAARIDAFALAAAQDLRRRTAFLQLAIWLLPILGFIGTVEGITYAIGGLEANALVAAAPGGGAGAVPRGMAEVMGGMKYAFDTTMVGLVLMIPLVVMSMMFKGKMETIHTEFQLRLLDRAGEAEAPPKLEAGADGRAT
jgi:hypothetical protein